MKKRQIEHLLRAFGEDRNGNFAVLFGLSAMMLLVAAGTAVDITRAYADKSDMSNAMDAAVLATAEAMSAGKCTAPEGSSTGLVNAAAKKCFDQFMAGNMANSADRNGAGAIATVVNVDSTTNTVSADARMPYTAAFGIFGNAGNFPIGSHAAATFGNNKAEVAMTFDLTGSMGGWKITALKAAAKNGINALLGSNSMNADRIRIAEVPYAASVNVGPDLAKYIWMDDGDPMAVAPDYVDPATGQSGGLNVSVDTNVVDVGLSVGGGNGVGLNIGQGSGLGLSIGGGSGSAPGNAAGGTSTQVSAPPDQCATERKGPEQFTDSGPESGMINRDGDLPENSCPEAKIVPLTSDATKLLAEVDNFRADGTTAGHIGIQWAWYMLSDKWADYLPDGSAASPSSDKKVLKYMIVMTDGMFNTAYSGYQPTDENGQKVAASSINDAEDLCTGIKADGIRIFTVGFGLNSGSAAEKTLQACASPATNGVSFYHNASDSQQLSDIYRAIAAQIQKLRLVS